MESVSVQASPKKPRTSPLMSPRLSKRSLSRGNSISLEDRTSIASRAVSATFDVKFKGHKTWTVLTRLDLGPNVHDEARFRDASAEVSWADIEAFSKEVNVSVPPGLHILIPALRGGLIRRWLELVAVERGLAKVLLFLHAEEVVRFPPRLNRVFSRALEDPAVEEELILG